MTTRRRRVGSETEQEPLLVVSSDYRTYPRQENHLDYKKNEDVQLDFSREASSKLVLAAKKDPSPRPAIMTSRDRTSEFVNAIKSFRNLQVARPFAGRDSRRKTHIKNYAEFMMIAKAIGKNISCTYAKLEKLTLLAKQKSLFNDCPTEINELTYIIKEDLNSLNQQIARLQEVARKQHSLQPSGHHLLSHSSNVVLGLQSKLASISTDFKQMLEVRTENLKQQKVRRDQFSHGHLSSPLPPSTVLLQDQQALAINMDDHELQQRQVTIAYETESYLQSRAETMHNIESTIVELGSIFHQLAHMVKEQEEMVERIDGNIQDAELNVESAHGEILKYFQSVTSSRWLMIKMFAVLIFFFIFFVVFML